MFFKKNILIILIATATFVLHAETGKQLFNLPEAKGARFKITDISWPEEYGQMEICLWKDDKYAALSLTVDDNCKPDHDWWLQQCEEFDLKITWFIITGQVGGPNKSFSGDWNDYIKLKEAGHSIQSHTATHNPNDNTREMAEVEQEYLDSKNALERNIPGNNCLAVAYPYGKGKPKLAAQHFIAARGTRGTPNMANQINYMNTNGGHFDENLVDSVLGNPIESPKWLANSNYKRGWISLLHHLVAHGNTPEDKERAIRKVRKFLEYVDKNRDRLWIDTFVNVAKYGQERDTARITDREVQPGKISFKLTDDMKDDIFNMPLTVKVRLDSNWNNVKITQKGNSIEAKIIEHNGLKYAIVQAVPDQGTVILQNEN